MGNTRICQWMNLLVFVLLLLMAEGDFIPITRLENAVSKGAVCLDGSPPAYHFDKGSGDGAKNWIVHMEGGGWCNNAQACLYRKDSHLGSSSQMEEPVAFSGILNNEQHANPDFYNWNRVKVRYCDGSSFTGDVEEVDPDNKLYFRGARIFAAVMEELLAKGMKNADNAILSGCSAGGLTAILHCDRFKDLLPKGARVKCVSDAGYFVNVKDISGDQRIAEFYNQVATTHGSAKNLPSSCTSSHSPGMCFFPQYAVSNIDTPIFVVNSPYDSWQINNILVPPDADPHGQWQSCKTDISNCSPDQLDKVQEFRKEFLSALNTIANSSSDGLYIDSCYAHCQTEAQETWSGGEYPLIGNKTIAKAVGDWFYERSHPHQIDCAYPCNPSCHNRVFADLKEHPGIVTKKIEHHHPRPRI